MKKFIVLIDGPMGAGKTTVAKLLHERVKNVAHIGLDRIKWLVSGFRRTKPQNNMTRAVVLSMAREYLKQGVNVVVEEGMKRNQVTAYKRLAKAMRVKFLMYKLEASKEVLFKRVATRNPAPGRTKVTLFVGVLPVVIAPANSIATPVTTGPIPIDVTRSDKPPSTPAV